MDAQYTGEMIAGLRKEKGITQKQLAAKLYVTDKAVSKWERGLNFPELSLLETLSKELDTTPLVLLGVENAAQVEVISSMAQLSQEQTEKTAKNIRRIGWLMVVAAVLLRITYYFVLQRLSWGGFIIEARPLTKVMKALIWMIGVGGIYILKKYGAIKGWEVADWLLAYSGFGGVLAYMGMHFWNRVNPGTIADVAFLIVYVIALWSMQLLCYRVLKPYLAKSLPLAVGVGFAVGGAINYLTALSDAAMVFGKILLYYVMPVVGCLIIWMICLIRDTERKRAIPTWRQVAIGAGIFFAIAFLFFQNSMIRTYVKVFHNQLETYAVNLSETNTEQAKSDRYGFWEVTCYAYSDIVEFQVGGAGLVPGSSYWGFYYSPDDTHRAFQGLDCEMTEITADGDVAVWEEEESDNGGTSIRIMENWYWFESHF